VYVTLIFGREITLIDTGVKGAHDQLFAYIEQQGRKRENIRTIILSHSHPDHIGSAKTIRDVTGAAVLAHPFEKQWIEDTDKQKNERPVPGFDMLVEGPVTLDSILEDGQTLVTGDDFRCQVFHTPGHSKGSISLVFTEEKVLFTGDALPMPGDLPIYDDMATSLRSLRKLLDLSAGANTVLSSWEEPVQGKEEISRRIRGSIAYLERIHNAVLHHHKKHNETGMALCRMVVEEIGLPPFAANPLVAKAFMSSLALVDRKDLFNF